MLKNYRITVRSKNDELTFAPYTPLRVLDGGLSGFDFPELEKSVMTNAFGDGGYTAGGVIAPRSLSILFEISDEKRFLSLRDRLAAVMNPHYRLSIRVNLYGRIREISASPAAPPEYSVEKPGLKPVCKLTFIAEEPFFTDAEGNAVVKTPQASPLLSFPTSFMKGAGTVCSFVIGSGFAKILNPGDVACGFVARVRVLNGEARSPRLSMDGKFLILRETVAAGDTVTFDTRPGSRRIAVNEVSSYKYDLKNTFFTLPSGYSYVYFSADNGSGDLDAVFEFIPLYMGV